MNHLLNFRVGASAVGSLSCSILGKKGLKRDTISCGYIKDYLTNAFPMGPVFNGPPVVSHLSG